MGEKCAICGDKCGIGSVKTNNGDNICSICVEKCGGKKNSKIKEMSIPELKDIVREYNKKALEARNTSTKSETIVQSETTEPKSNSTEPANSNTVNNNTLNTKAPINTSKKGCGCLNIIAALIFVIIVSSLWGAISKESYKSMSLEKALQAIAESESMVYDGVTIDDNGVVDLYMIANDYTSKDSLIYRTVNIMEKIKGRNNYSQLGIRYKMNLYDKKGNAESNLVMVVDISKDTIETINYDNFRTSNLPDLADEFFVHPALEE